MFGRIEQQIVDVLDNKFDQALSAATVKFYQTSIWGFQESDWEKCLRNAGKMMEAVTRLLMKSSGLEIPPAKKFQAGRELQQLKSKAPNTPDTVSLHIPRPAIFVYDVASNRGARHFIPGIDPDEMDSRAVVPVISWILAELVHFSGGHTTKQAMSLIASLMERQFPLFEKINGKIYINYNGLSAYKTMILLLYRVYPRRLLVDQLINWTSSHGYKIDNCKVALMRLRKKIDYSNSGVLLRGNGRKEAEELLVSMVH